MIMSESTAITEVKMQFVFGRYLLEIDTEKTRKFYQTAEKLTDGCTCSGCRNFEKAVDSFPEEVKQFFEEIGVSPEKSAEVFVNCAEDDKKNIFYGGFCHICGKVLKGNSPWVPEGETAYRWETENTYQIAEGYKVGFENGGALIEDNFPEPVMQMEIEFHMPWVLQEENDYPG